MRKYDSYKDSKVSWIGDIPEHWNLKRMRFVAKLYNGDSLNDTEKSKYADTPDDDESIPYIASKDIDRDTEFINYENGIRIPKNEPDFKVAPAGTSLLCIEGGSAGKKMGFVNQDVCFVNKLCCFDAVINNKFLYYFIKSKSFWEVFSQNIQGMIGGVTISRIKDFAIPVPLDEEQDSIVAYLDKKCTDIDKAIDIQQQRINLLNELRLNTITDVVLHGIIGEPEYDSSKDMWHTKVSKHRKIIRFKYAIQLIDSGVSVNSEQQPACDNELGVLKTSCVSKNVFIPTENKKVLEDEVKRLACPVRKKTVIVSRMNTPELVGAAGYVDDDYLNLFLPDRLWCVSFKEDIIVPKYAWYFLISKYAKNYYTSISTGTSSSMQNISMGQFENVLIPLPSIEAQNRFVEYLDEKVSRIDFCIANAELVIEKLRSYRQILITEIVTGKRKVI